MNSQLSATPAELNSTIVKPLGFYINGFHSLQNTHYYFIFLSFVYLATLLANFLLMAIIWFVESLHTPKYLAIFSLSVVDVSYSTAIIPKAIDVFLFNSRFVFYDVCFTQLFFVHYFCAMESFTLAVLAYDRLISICFPLRSNTINTNTRMILIIAVTWIIPFVFMVVTIFLLKRLSFCKSTAIESYFCDHGPVFVLACNDNSPNWTNVYFYVVGIICLPLAFIIISYVSIIVSLLKIASAEGRRKAFKTCSTHLTLVAIFYIPLLVTYIIVLVKFRIDTDVRILNTSLSATLPPLLNPIIYTLKTEEIWEQIKNFRKRMVNPMK